MATKWPYPPKQFDVVWCRIPYAGQQEDVRHPCLVLAISVSPANVMVMVAGGTSVAKDGHFVRQIKATDFVLQDPSVLQQAGLTNKTAFQFEAGTIMTFAWDNDRFVAGPPQGAPVAGTIDLKNTRTYQALIAAGKASNLNSLMEGEKQRVRQSGNSSLEEATDP